MSERTRRAGARPAGAHLAFLQKTQTSLAPRAQASLKLTNTLCPIFYYIPPKNQHAPSLRRSESACSSAQARVQARRGCIRKDAPAGAEKTDKYAIPPLFCTPPRGQKRARGDSRHGLREGARRSAPMPKARRAGAPRGGWAPRRGVSRRRRVHPFRRNYKKGARMRTCRRAVF